MQLVPGAGWHGWTREFSVKSQNSLGSGSSCSSVLWASTAGATHRAPGWRFRGNNATSYRPLNGHCLIKSHKFFNRYPSVLKVWIGSKTFGANHQTNTLLYITWLRPIPSQFAFTTDLWHQLSYRESCAHFHVKRYENQIAPEQILRFSKETKG